MTSTLRRALGRFSARGGRCTTPLERRRILALIDAGADYASIRSEFGISAAHIDLILRLHAD